MSQIRPRTIPPRPAVCVYSDDNPTSLSNKEFLSQVELAITFNFRVSHTLIEVHFNKTTLAPYSEKTLPR